MYTKNFLKALLLLGSVLAATPVCVHARLLAEWSSIQQIEPGRRVRVLLYDDRAPDGKLKFDGNFVAAAGDSLTLILKDGSARTLSSRMVRRVARRRPFLRRPKAWVITGTVLVLVGVMALNDTDYLNVITRASDINIHRSIATWFLPTYGLAALASSRVVIYNVPRKHRSP